MILTVLLENEIGEALWMRRQLSGSSGTSGRNVRYIEGRHSSQSEGMVEKSSLQGTLVSPDWLGSSICEGEYYKIRQKRLKKDQGRPQCQAKEFRLDFVGNKSFVFAGFDLGRSMT